MTTHRVHGRGNVFAIEAGSGIQHRNVAGEGVDDLFFGRILFARGAADVFDNILAVAPLGSGFLSHLHSLVVAMCQKTSLIKST